MIHNQNGLTWNTFSLFEDSCPELKHGYFTRAGGVSGPNGDELNLAFSEANDARENVLTNIRRAEKALGLSGSAFVRQTHSANVAVIYPSDNYHPLSSEELWYGYDAMVAPEPGITLLMKVADCQCITFYDPVARILGMTHSGWRGSVQNIIGATVVKMTKYGAVPARILAAAAPSLGPCCAEFINYKKELPIRFQDFMVSDNHFDFWAISRKQLTDCGLRPENIEIAGICTKCSPDYFSYRGGDKWARFGVMAGCEPEES